MKITKTIDLQTASIGSRKRMLIGWVIVVGLTFLELIAVLYGKPSILKSYTSINTIIATVANWIPLVDSFARCAKPLDSGSGLMLALNVVFFPIKLIALYYAHPKKLQNPDKGFRAIFGTVYVFLIALVALTPTWVWMGMFAPGASGLVSIDRKTQALCSGGLPAFFASQLQGGFALLGAFVSVVIFVGIARSLRTLIFSNK